MEGKSGSTLLKPSWCVTAYSGFLPHLGGAADQKKQRQMSRHRIYCPPIARKLFLALRHTICDEEATLWEIRTRDTLVNCRKVLEYNTYRGPPRGTYGFRKVPGCSSARNCSRMVKTVLIEIIRSEAQPRSNGEANVQRL